MLFSVIKAILQKKLYFLLKHFFSLSIGQIRMESFIHRKMQKLETKISLIVKTIEIIFLQYKLEKVAVDSLLPTQFDRVTVPKREVCSWVSLHKFIFSDVIFQEHLRCSRFSVDNTEKLQLTLTLHSAPHPMQQSTTFCHSTHLHSCQSISRSVQFSWSVVSDALQPHGQQHARPPCPSPTPGVYSNSCPLSRWCHPTISSSVEPFSSCLQSFPASGSFLMTRSLHQVAKVLVSASISVLPMNTQDWLPLGWTG